MQAHASKKQAKANKCEQNHAHASKSEQMQAKAYKSKQFASKRKQNQTNWLAFASFCLHLLVFAWRFLAFCYFFMENSTT